MGIGPKGAMKIERSRIRAVGKVCKSIPQTFPYVFIDRVFFMMNTHPFS
jgi:hypothetical protein